MDSERDSQAFFQSPRHLSALSATSAVNSSFEGRV